MGQYYKIEMLGAVPDSRYGGFRHRHISINPGDFDQGVKLMEFAYDGGIIARVVIKQIMESDHAYVGIIGDYSEIGDAEIKVDGLGQEILETRANMGRELITARSNKYVTDEAARIKEYPRMGCHSHMTVFNMDRMEYIHVPLEGGWEGDRRVWRPSALLLLLAVGNGRGGGDYNGTNTELVGRWAFQKIFVRPGKTEIKGYTKLDPEFVE